MEKKVQISIIFIMIAYVSLCPVYLDLEIDIRAC